jgi:hypothetical protein
MGDLPPGATVRVAEVANVVGEFPTIAIGHRGLEPATIAGSAEFDLGDAGKVLSEGIFVVGVGGAQAVVVDLLVEIEIRFRSFTGPGKAGVKDRLSIRRPSGAAAGGGILDAGDLIGQSLSGHHVVERKRSVLTAIF